MGPLRPRCFICSLWANGSQREEGPGMQNKTSHFNCPEDHLQFPLYRQLLWVLYTNRTEPHLFKGRAYKVSVPRLNLLLTIGQYYLRTINCVEFWGRNKPEGVPRQFPPPKIYSSLIQWCRVRSPRPQSINLPLIDHRGHFVESTFSDRLEIDRCDRGLGGAFYSRYQCLPCIDLLPAVSAVRVLRKVFRVCRCRRCIHGGCRWCSFGCGLSLNWGRLDSCGICRGLSPGWSSSLFRTKMMRG